MHMGVACDNCEQCPIVGMRYNSQVVNNYDLCERCHNLPGAEAVAPFRLVQNEKGASYPLAYVLLSLFFSSFCSF